MCITYMAICYSAGRQVPSPWQTQQLPASFQVGGTDAGEPSGYAHPRTTASRPVAAPVAIDAAAIDLGHRRQPRSGRPSASLADLHKAIACSVDQNTVVNSIPGYPEVKNSLDLRFSPGPNPPSQPVMAGPQTIFTVTFVYGDGAGDLTTAQLAAQFSFERGTNAENWHITSLTDAQSPSWTSQPPENTPIVGIGVQATVGFHIGYIVTELPPGSTIMNVSYAGIPGYTDGAFSILLQTVQHVSISTLKVVPNPAPLKDGYASAIIRWNVDSATIVTLNAVDVTDCTQYPAIIKEATCFNLEAYGHTPNVDT